jgi:SAM-dependent methyltransferase
MSVSMQCPACGGPTAEPRRYPVVEFMLETGDVFHYEPCTRCGTSAIVDPAGRPRPLLPERLRALRRAARRDPGRAAPLRPRRPLARGAPGGSRADARVLDVGCGSGDFLRTLAVQGFRDLTGVDPFLPFEPRVEGPCRFVRGDVAALGGERFDLVTAHHVIEHAPDPRRFLREIAGVLAPDGAVLVRAPLLDSWAARTYGARWVQHDAPRHLVLLTTDGMGRAAEAAGLRVTERWRDEGRWQAWAGATLAAGRNPFRASGLGVRLGRFRYSAAARRRNREGTGDSGCFVLRHAAAAGAAPPGAPPVARA